MKATLRVQLIVYLINMNRNYLVWLIVLGCYSGLNAQEKRIQAQAPDPIPTLSVSYYGETLIHSGIKLGYEHPLSSRILELRNHRYLYVSGNLGYVSHRSVYRALFADGTLGYRFFPRSSIRMGAWMGLGLQRYSLASPSYAIQTDGSFAQISSGGTRFMTSFGLELGMQNQQSTSFFLKPQLVILSPHNTGSLKQLVLEFGLSFPLANL